MNKIIAFILSIFTCRTVSAQTSAFISSCSENSTLFQAENIIDPFRDLIEKKKALTIVQFGDSHIQMGHYARGIKNGLGQIAELKHEGFWVPLTECGGWGPESYAFRSKGKWSCSKLVNAETNRYGITGFAYTLERGKGHVSISHKKIGKTLHSIEVFHEYAEDFKISVKNASVTTTKIGNSAVSKITFDSPVNIGKLTFTGGKDNPVRLFGFRVDYEKPSDGFEYHHYGAGGGKYSDFILRCSYFYEQLNYLKPDVLIISLGTNDAHANETKEDFQTKVASFIDSIQAKFPSTKIVMTTQPETAYQNAPAPKFDLVFGSLKNIATEKQLTLWDLAKAMGGEKSIYKWIEQGIVTKDQMHFSIKGYHLQGELFVYALLKSLLEVGVYQEMPKYVFSEMKN